MAFKLAETPSSVWLQGSQETAKAGHRCNMAYWAWASCQPGAAPLQPSSSPALGHLGTFLYPSTRTPCRGTPDITFFLPQTWYLPGGTACWENLKPSGKQVFCSTWERPSLNRQYKPKLPRKFHENRIFYLSALFIALWPALFLVHCRCPVNTWMYLFIHP